MKTTSCPKVKTTAAMLTVAALLLLAGPGSRGPARASAMPNASPAGRAQKPESPMTPGTKAVVEGNNAFALELYARLKDDPAGKNLFISPFSISTALAMTYGGARGDTERQMARVLHFALGQDELHPAFRSTMALVNPTEGKRECQLLIANALWGQRGFKWLPDFLDLTKAHYGAELRDVDFVGDPEGARGRINAWAEDKTQGRIKNVLNPTDIDASTRLILANAIYFKGDWSRQFQTDRTRKGPFHLAGGEDVTASLMDHSEYHPYASVEGVQVLELPYKGDELSMVLLLPTEMGGLKALEESLTIENLGKWIRAMEGQKVHVIMPKFSVECRFDLGATLAAMGMSDAFDAGKADFSGMNVAVRAADRLFFSKVIHKTFVGVNEAGTEAAAVTAVGMLAGAAPGPRKEPPLFRADHPFLFLIRDNTTESILFLGRLMDPSARKSSDRVPATEEGATSVPGRGI